MVNSKLQLFVYFCLELRGQLHGCVVICVVCVSRLLETEKVCPMCSETLSVKQVKKVSNCSAYLQESEVDQ